MCHSSESGFECEIVFQNSHKHNAVNELAIPVSITCPGCHCRIQDCKGIIDTGATSSMIAQKIAADLELIPHGQTGISGVHGTERANLYRVDLILGQGFILPNIEVSEAGNDAGFDFLIGMDIISHGKMIFLGDELSGSVFKLYLPLAVRLTS